MLLKDWNWLHKACNIYATESKFLFPFLISKKSYKLNLSHHYQSNHQLPSQHLELSRSITPIALQILFFF